LPPLPSPASTSPPGEKTTGHQESQHRSTPAAEEVAVSVDTPATALPGPSAPPGVGAAVPAAEASTGSPVPAQAGAVSGSPGAAASAASVDNGANAPVDNGMEHFHRLRRRLLLATLTATAVAFPGSWLLFDLPTAASLLTGSLAGLLYLLLLARSVARLGGDRRSVGKLQLLAPVALVLASARIPQLSLVPALIGFLLYKPALLIQAYLDR